MVKCWKCGERVCKDKAVFYSGDLKWLCNKCRKKELEKELTITRLKTSKLPKNIKLSIG